MTNTTGLKLSKRKKYICATDKDITTTTEYSYCEVTILTFDCRLHEK